MDFYQKVLNLTKKIPRGKVTTYGEIARALKTSPRAVGQALKRNKKLIVIPCHRVVCADGSLGGYSQGLQKKIFLLEHEGIKIRNKKISNFSKVLYKVTEIYK